MSFERPPVLKGHIKRSEGEKTLMTTCNNYLPCHKQKDNIHIVLHVLFGLHSYHISHCFLSDIYLCRSILQLLPTDTNLSVWDLFYHGREFLLTDRIISLNPLLPELRSSINTSCSDSRPTFLWF